MRGAVSENTKINPALVFIKHLSERYEQVKDLEKQINTPWLRPFLLKMTTPGLESILRDPTNTCPRTPLSSRESTLAVSERQCRPGRYQGSGWTRCLDMIQDPVCLQPATINLLHLYPKVSCLTGKLAANLLSHPKFLWKRENPESDILGRIYEYYIGKFAMAVAWCRTVLYPGSIVRLLVELLLNLLGTHI